MKNNKVLNYMIFILVFLIFPIGINASNCDNYKAEANKIETSYKLYYDKDDMPNFKINIKNISNNLYVVTEYGEELKSEFNTIATDSTQTLALSVYSKDANCKEVLRTINLDLPLYNEIADYKICEGIEDYKYCKKLINENVTIEQIRDRVKLFRNEVEDERHLTKYENLDDALVLKDVDENNDRYDYTFILLLGVVILLIIILIIVLIIYKKNRKKMEI